MAEWSCGVHPIEGIATMLASLARSHRLAIVTNTHSSTLVPGHLDAMGVAPCFDAVISSVEVGWRKPHPAIYQDALARLEASPPDTVFVGDTRGPDYDGPRTMGMRAFLIDPDRRHDIPEAHRLMSVHDLTDRL
ncbi:MAG: HAD-IA family hydrolase [Acidimicrobiales bacterium]